MTTHRPDSRPNVEAGNGPTAAREIGPARFQRVLEAPRRSGVAASLGSALVLLLLVVGVPVALVWLGGVPGLPTSLPTREQLTATIGIEQLMSVLLWVVWIAWLQFTICVVVELRSALSGVGLPARVPLAGPSQRVARTLVASVLLLVTAVGPATALTPQTATGPTGTSTSISQTDVAGTEADAAVGAVGPAAGVEAASPAGDVAGSTEADVGEVTYHLGERELSPQEGAALEGKPVYVVQPPEGRYHDNLWDIAERTLGDGRRYQEIFELNKGRVQPDGHELSLARLIYPSWLLVMPDDATGVERVVAQAVQPEVAPVEVAADGAVGDAAATSAGTDLGGSADGALPHAAATVVDDAAHGPTSQHLVGAGLLAAGLLAAVEGLRRRRRTAEPGDDAVDAEVALRIGARPDRVELLDAGLRRLAAGLRDHGTDLPGVYAALVGDARLELHLAPARTDAPAPWVAQGEGAVWTLDAADLDRSPVRAPAPYPGLVSVGQDADGSDVLIDLEAAQGPVAVVGDPVVALEVATAVAAELATNRWSDGLRVTGYGLPAELAALDQRYRAVETIEAALPALRDRRLDGAPDALGTGVLTGRLRGSGLSTWIPEYLVLGRLPDPETAARLVELATTDQRSPLGVVCVGDLPGARWRLEVDDAGGLGVRVLGIGVQANRLAAGRLDAVAELLTGTVDAPATRPDVEHEPLLDRPDVLAPQAAVTPADLAAAPVRVRVLGAPRVETAGVLDAERVALATELVTYLALHPEGVHPSVLSAELWPRGVTAAVRDATIERTRSWLGSDPSGAPHLRERADGHLVLGPGVVLDWDVVRTCLAQSRGADPVDERRLLTEALRLAPTAVLAQRPTGRYSWLARVRVERSSRELLVDAAHRLVQLCRHDDDPDAARAAARAGLRVAPTEELLWRDVLRAVAVLGGADAVRTVAAELEQTLHSEGIAEASPPTVALLTELVPDVGPVGGDGALRHGTGTA